MMAKRVLTKQELEDMGILKTVVISKSDDGVPSTSSKISGTDFKKHQQLAQNFQQQTNIFDISDQEYQRR